VGVSADPPATLAAFQRQAGVRHRLLSDGGRQVLSAYGALVTDEKSPMRGYAKRAYFVIDREGVVRYARVNENPLDLLAPAEILQALRESGAR
jgi:peroxiredoxin